MRVLVFESLCAGVDPSLAVARGGAGPFAETTPLEDTHTAVAVEDVASAAHAAALATDVAPGAAAASLLGEGAAMLAALVEDFSALGGVDVVLVLDRRWGSQAANRLATAQARRRIVWTDSPAAAARTIEAESRRADWTVVIAPELGGELADWCARVRRCGGRLLGPGAATLAVASDKHATCEHLARAGLPVPEGIAIGPGGRLPAGFPLPAVRKPRDGAGSLGVRVVYTPADAATWAERVEAYCPGSPASVCVLCGPGIRAALPPCGQLIAGRPAEHLRDGGLASLAGPLRYQGGWFPLAPPLAARAVRLARAAADTFGDALGWLGVDLVLGRAADGADDRVIEINPRLTTSYLGLRRALEGNLAEAMLHAAAGKLVSVPARAVALSFDTTGRVDELLSPPDTQDPYPAAGAMPPEAVER